MNFLQSRLNRIILRSIPRILMFMVGIICTTVVALGRDFIENQSDYQINWGTYKLRFYSEAAEKKLAKDSVSANEKAILKESSHNFPLTVEEAKKDMPKKLIMITEKILHEDARRRKQEQKENDTEIKSLSEALIKMAYTLDTKYLGDGTVRITWETDLRGLSCSPKFKAKLTPLSPPSSSDEKYSGLIIIAEGQKPTTQVALLVENGANLATLACSPSLNPRDAFMPRWVMTEKPSELSRSVGDKPLIIKTKSLDPGRLTIDNADFQAHGGEIINALKRGRIVFSVK